MAIFTSTNGYFEITDISFSPNKVVAEEELGSRSGLQKTTYSITIKNVSGKKITGLSLYMAYGWLNAQGEETGSGICYLYGDLETRQAITWNANASKTFTGEWDVVYSGTECAPVFSAHALKPYYSTLFSRTKLLTLTVIPNPEDYYDSFSDISGENQKYLAVLDGFYSPSVVTFDADRVVSDEDPNIKTTVKLSLADGLSDDQKARMKWTVYCDGTSIPYDTDVTLDQLLAGITDSTTFITQQFDKDSDYDLVLTFGDEYEIVTSSTITIPRGFANVHLSGNEAGGVCFGGFCDTENPGRFECYYPAYFYNGITVGGGSGGSIELEADTLLFGFMSNSKKDIYLTVPVPYMPSSVTTVTVTSIKGNVRCAGGYGAASAYVEGGTDYTGLVAAVTPCPSTGTVVIKLTRSTAMNGTNNYALTFQVSELKMTIS